MIKYVFNDMPFQIVKRIFLYSSLFERGALSNFGASPNERLGPNTINTVVYRAVF